MSDSHYIDPQVRPILDHLASQFGDYLQLSVDETRAMYAQGAAAMAAPLPAGCEDGRFSIPGPGGPIDCRYFRPIGLGPCAPVVVHFIGGTYVATSLDHLGPVAPAMAMTANCIVVVPLHRIPPEHPFPAAYDDCHAVYSWVCEHSAEFGGDGNRVVLFGESSGGTLAAAVCLDARDQGLKQPLLQVLAEPLLDHAAETSSINEFAYVLSKAAIRYGSSLYFGGNEPPVRASPLRAASVAGVAPAYIVTAGLDPLRDEAIAYVARLRSEGGTVFHRHHDGQIHGFFSMFGQITQARIAFRECCATIALAFAGGIVAVPAAAQKGVS